MVGLSDDSDDGKDFDFEEDNADTKDRPSKPSHVHFGKWTIGSGHIVVLKNSNYISDISIVRLVGEEITPLPKKDEVVVFWSFIKAGLQFPLHKVVVEVLKTLISTFIS